MNPVVSIIIPTFNRAYELSRALTSVLGQTFHNWEAIVIDNSSCDGTEKKIAEFGDARIRFFEIQNHGVVAASRNLGINQARGRYVAFLDSDDWWAPTKLAECLVLLEEGFDFIFHDEYVVHSMEILHGLPRIGIKKCTRPIYEYLMTNLVSIPNSSVVVRKDLLNKVGRLSEDPRLIAFEDFDCWIRISQHSDKFQCIQKCLGYYWAGGGNLSKSNRLHIDKIKFLYYKNLDVIL